MTGPHGHSGSARGLNHCSTKYRLPQRRNHEMTTKKLNGKTAVITGGATGIGIAAAKRFIEDGAFVFIFGRRQEALDAALAELGPNARAVRGQISDPADLARLSGIGREAGRDRVWQYV